MARFSVMRTAMNAAVPCTVDNSSCVRTSRAASCANTMDIALILDVTLVASIFVALITLASLLGLSLITLISLLGLLALLILGTTAYRLKDLNPDLM